MSPSDRSYLCRCLVALLATGALLGLALGASCALGGCMYSLTPQDRQAIETAAAMEAAVYCRLDGGAARAFLRAEHAELAGVLRRNSADAGAADAGIPCP